MSVLYRYGIEIEKGYQSLTTSNPGGFESDGQQMEFVNSYPSSPHDTLCLLFVVSVCINYLSHGYSI